MSSYYPDSASWLALAETLKPSLYKSEVSPRSVIAVEKDADAFQGWRVTVAGEPSEAGNHLWQRCDSQAWDFGSYCVGYLRFDLEIDGIVDCPLRLEIKLAETPAELGEDFSEYQGSLGRGWLQEEILVLDEPGGTIRLPRRYAFRYVKITALYNADGYSFRLKNPVCETVTSADSSCLAPLPDTVSPLLRQIDQVSTNTLKNCMQTVFEDGPKRDRRLWLGDFRLQALANYHTFRNYALCRRCLYLFAGLADERGLVPSCLYERPQRGKSEIYDYTALFVPTLLEYADASGDWQTAAELWPVAQRQLEIALEEVDNDGLFRDRRHWWLFIDWASTLDKQAAEQGVVIFSLRQAVILAHKLGDDGAAERWREQADKMAATALTQLWDNDRRLFVSGASRQISWASQIWLILAGVLTPEQAVQTLQTVMNDPDAVRPAGPYLYHYAVDALLSVGLKNEAEALLAEYWGAMVRLGADNFWEVFDPADPYLSPYQSHIMNSYCHAWSCTPTYFLRRDLVS